MHLKFVFCGGVYVAKLFARSGVYFGVRQNERSAARTSLFKKDSALFEYYHSVALLTPKSKNWPRFCSSARWYTTLAQPMSIAPVPIGRHTMR